MSLRVRCPEGCIIHASVTRCGKVVRCPKCRTMIRIPEISDAEKKSGRAVECRAEIYEAPNDQGVNSASSISGDSMSKDAHERRLPVVKPRQHSSSESKQSLPSVSVEIVGKPLPINPPSSQSAIVSSGEGGENLTKDSQANDVAPAYESVVRANSDMPFAGSIKGNSSRGNEEKTWEERLTRANADRFFLAKLFAGGLFFVAGLNLIPVLTQLITWGDSTPVNELPNWFFWQLAICLLNGFYAIFLLQINDWSAMRSVSVLLLVHAFIYGVCCTGLLLGGNGGSLMMWLEISSARFKQATSGYAVLLCLATLMSYWAAKEASNWQRAEQVLKQILFKRKS